MEQIKIILVKEINNKLKVPNKKRIIIILNRYNNVILQMNLQYKLFKIKIITKNIMLMNNLIQ